MLQNPRCGKCQNMRLNAEGAKICATIWRDNGDSVALNTGWRVEGGGCRVEVGVWRVEGGGCRV